jgi:Uma2 family endonuclease
MTDTIARTEGRSLVLHLRPAIDLDDRQFAALARQNPELRLERTAEGDVLVMPPTGGETGNRNAGVTAQLWIWALQDGTGAAFDSSTGFVLPNGATRSPDAAWVSAARLGALTAEQRERFLPLCPDFVIELRSPSDSLAATQAKLEEYIANGARLGWLLDVPNRHTYVYRPDSQTVRLEAPTALSADLELAGFVLDLTLIWEPRF